MTIPIALTTYNRPDYLKQTVESLRDSNYGFKNVTIYDDCSDSVFKNKMLQFYGKYSVIQSDKNGGTYKACCNSIERAYCSYLNDYKQSPKYIVYLQDDIILSKNWFDDAVKIMEQIENEHENVAYLSLYNRQFNSDCVYSIIDAGHPGAVAWLIRTEFWDKFVKSGYTGVEYLKNNDKRVSHMQRNLCDWKIARAAYGLGYRVAVVGKSLVQHVGDKSSLFKGKDMSFCRTDNFVEE